MIPANPRNPAITAGWPRRPSQWPTCRQCGTRFAAYFITARYCTPRCRKAAWRASHV